MPGMRNNTIQEVEGIYLSESLVNYSGARLSQTPEASLASKLPLIAPPADRKHSHGRVTIP